MIWQAFLAALSALALAGCSPEAVVSETVKEESSVLHAKFNARDFAGIYDMASPEFRRSVDREAFIGFLQRSRDQLGRIEQAKPAGVLVNVIPQGTRRILVSNLIVERGFVTCEAITLLDGELIHYALGTDRPGPCTRPGCRAPPANAT